MLFKQQQEQQPLWFLGFILLLLLFPLPFGGNRFWASDLFALLSGLCMMAMLWSHYHAPAQPLTGRPPRLRIFYALTGFSLVALWSFLQTQSWMPTTWHHPMWGLASEHLGEVKSSIALNPSLFPEAFLKLLSYAVCFLIPFFACRKEASAKFFVQCLAYAAGAYALYGLIVQSSGTNTILWFDKWAYEGFLTSTFVNKNSYATYAGLGLLCCFGQLYLHMRSVKIKDKILAKKTRSLALFASLSLKDLTAFLPTIFVLAALALTGSRGGVISSFVGLASAALAFAFYKRIKPKNWIWMACLLGGFFILFVGMGGETLLHRLAETKVSDDAALRLTAYELSATAIADNPLLGYGLGNFEEAFRIYRDDRLSLWYHHAHNDYLEMMMDLGVPMAFLLFSVIAVLTSCCIGGIMTRRKAGLYPTIAIGATAIIATHAFMDFSMHIPAIAATYAALLGMGVAQSWSSRRSKKGKAS